ncbi:MAG: hypothetical protein SO238_11655 [Treponema sp.]|nr:hypothetical protein [Treponema sp.]
MDSTLLSEKIKSKLNSYLNYTFSKGEISKILKEMNNNKQYAISPKALDSKFFIGYSMKKDELVIGDIKSDIKVFGRDSLKQVLLNRGYTKESFGAKTYYYLEISNPKIISTSELAKAGLDINSIKNNAIITNFAPKVLEHE